MSGTLPRGPKGHDVTPILTEGQVASGISTDNKGCLPAQHGAYTCGWGACRDIVLEAGGTARGIKHPSPLTKFETTLLSSVTIVLPISHPGALILRGLSDVPHLASSSIIEEHEQVTD